MMATTISTFTLIYFLFIAFVLGGLIGFEVSKRMWIPIIRRYQKITQEMLEAIKAREEFNERAVQLVERIKDAVARREG